MPEIKISHPIKLELSYLIYNTEKFQDNDSFKSLMM